LKFVILVKSEQTNHKYLRKYKGKNGKWVYIYKESSVKKGKDELDIQIKPQYKAQYQKYYNQYAEMFSKIPEKDVKGFKNSINGWMNMLGNDKTIPRGFKENPVGKIIINTTNENKDVKDLLMMWCHSTYSWGGHDFRKAIYEIEDNVAERKKIKKEKDDYHNPKNLEIVLKLRAFGQAYFDVIKNDVKEIQLYRAIGGDTGKQILKGLQENAEISYRDLPMSSWTIKRKESIFRGIGDIAIKHTFSTKDIFLPREILYSVFDNGEFADEHEYMVVGRNEEKPINKNDVVFVERGY